ncbi:MAG: RsmE family RNA methyltransferase [Bacilli bacterium]
MQRYFTNLKENNNFILNSDDLYHLKVVMRATKNDMVEVVYNNKLYIAMIDNNNVVLKNEVEDNILKQKELILCIPLLAEQKMSFVLQKATELGIDKIIPFITTRSIVKLDEKKELKKLERWYKICKEASQQSKRLTIPIISSIKTIEDLNIDGLKILCSTIEKANTLKKVLNKVNIYDTIVIVVGPEGGLTKDEEQRLIKQGFIATSLGKNIMRVETVPIYLLSVINYEMME